MAVILKAIDSRTPAMLGRSLSDFTDQAGGRCIQFSTRQAGGGVRGRAFSSGVENDRIFGVGRARVAEAGGGGGGACSGGLETIFFSSAIMFQLRDFCSGIKNHVILAWGGV